MRSRLVLVVAAMTALALVVANLAGLVLLRSYLGDRIDEQVTGMARPFGTAARPPADPQNPPPGGFSGRRALRLGEDQVMYVYTATGELDAVDSSAADGSHPAAPAYAEALEHATQGKLYTLAAADGSAHWRMIARPLNGTASSGGSNSGSATSSSSSGGTSNSGTSNSGTSDSGTSDSGGGASGGVVVIGASLAQVEETGDRLLLIDLGVMVLVLGLLAVGAAFVVRLGLRPLTEMERLAEDISAGNLSGRVADTDPHTEPGRLGRALNLMLARIEAEISARTASEQRLRQFVADASHELRTPLTSIRGFAELYRRGGAPPGPQLDETMSRIEGEAGRMGVLVEDMLLLARLDRQRPPARRPVDLLEIAADTIRDAHARVPDRPVRLAALDDHSDTFVPPTVLGDEHELRQVATNLVANALQHTTRPAAVTVRVGRVDRHVPGPGVVRAGVAVPGVPLAVLEVSDDGPGVPAEHAPRVFERLYRADSSRTRGKGGGSGLGLSIVAAIVSGHGGWVELDRDRKRGATFRVFIPAIADAEP